MASTLEPAPTRSAEGEHFLGVAFARVRHDERARGAAELLGAWVLLELTLWIPGNSGAGPWRLLPALALALLVVRSLRRRRSLRGLNVSAPLATSWAWTAVGTLAGVGLVFGVARLGGYGQNEIAFDFLSKSPAEAEHWFAGKLLAVSTQQLALQIFALPLCRELLGRTSAAVALSAALFGLLHIPNAILMLAAGLAALGWCLLYLRHGRLLPLIVSHLLLAIVARAAFGDAIYNMRVGAAVLPLLPSTLAATDGSSLRVTPLALDGFVDGCDRGEERVICVGWAADIERREVARGVVVLAAGSFHHFPLTGLERPDVAEHFGRPAIARSGFRLSLPTRWFHLRERVRFFALGLRDRATELEYGPGYSLDSLDP